jgi:hypothetical protein
VLGVYTFAELIEAAADDIKRKALIAVKGISPRNLDLWARTAAALIAEAQTDAG